MGLLHEFHIYWDVGAPRLHKGAAALDILAALFFLSFFLSFTLWRQQQQMVNSPRLMAVIVVVVLVLVLVVLLLLFNNNTPVGINLLSFLLLPLLAYPTPHLHRWRCTR